MGAPIDKWECHGRIWKEILFERAVLVSLKIHVLSILVIF